MIFTPSAIVLFFYYAYRMLATLTEGLLPQGMLLSMLTSGILHDVDFDTILTSVQAIDGVAGVRQMRLWCSSTSHYAASVTVTTGKS